MANIMMANIVKNPPERLESYLAKQEAPAQPSPGLTLFYQFAGFSSKAMIPVDNTQPEAFRQQEIQVAAARSTAILAHLAVVIGMVLVGYRHFDNIHTGVAAATLYLLTFYTSQMTGQVDHVVPAALLVWAIVAYRRPMIAGVFLGIAVGVIYYPWFLLPLVVRILLAARRGAIHYRRGFGPGDHDRLAGHKHGHLGNVLAAIAIDARLAQSLGSGLVGLLEIPRAECSAFRCLRPSWHYVAAWPSGRRKRISARC